MEKISSYDAVEQFSDTQPVKLNIEEKVGLRHMWDYFCGKSLDESAMDRMKGRGFKGGPKGAIRLPASVRGMVMPEIGQLYGKSLPMVSTGANAQNVVQGTMLTDTSLQRPAGEPPAIFPRVFTIPTKGGTGYWPQLTDSAPGAEGAPEEFDEYGGARCDWKAEGAESEKPDPIFEKKQIVCYELSAYTEISFTLFNAVSTVMDVMVMLRAVLRPPMLHKIDNAIRAGNGTGKPEGYLNEDGIGEVNRAALNEISLDDLIDMEMKLPPHYRANAAYVLSDSAFKYLRKKKDGANRLLHKDLGGPMPLLNGYPAIPTQRAPALGTRGDVSFADFGQYVCPIEQDFLIETSGLAKASHGVVCVIATMLLGGKAVRPRAFATLDDPAA